MMNYHAAKKDHLSIEYFGDIDQFHIEDLSFRQRIVLNLEDWDIFSGLVEKMNEYLNGPEEDPVFDPQDLKHGVYRIYWKDGGSSVASVGSTSDGTRWYQPSNWISEEVCTSWSRVERVELIETQNPPSDE